MGNKTKNILKTVLKFVVSGVALYVVFLNVDWKLTQSILLSANVGWLVVAGLFFIFSKVVSAYRLNIYFQAIGLRLTPKYNLRLYLVGMFYNLFLPGGIGGDGFKVYLLNKKFGTKVKPLIRASLMDRVSGLVVLLFLASIGYFFINSSLLPNWIFYANAFSLLLIIPIYSYGVNRFFNVFHASFWLTNFYSLGVQWLQVLSAYFILLSLGVSDLYLEYLVLFLISSVVAVFPFTIGGIGARELTFILGYQYVGIDENVAVAFSLLFFLITAIVSMFGGFVRLREKDN